MNEESLVQSEGVDHQTNNCLPQDLTPEFPELATREHFEREKVASPHLLASSSGTGDSFLLPYYHSNLWVSF